MALTKRQKQVVDFIAGFIRRNGYSPSFEEIAEELGLASLATVHKHLTALESKRYLKRSFNQSRALDLGPQYYRELSRQRKEAALASPETPLLGTIAAGQPIETYPDPETLSFADFVGAEQVYALRVRGESMIEDHIMDGDYVLVEKTDRVSNGDIVVALVEGAESTLKRFLSRRQGSGTPATRQRFVATYRSASQLRRSSGPCTGCTPQVSLIRRALPLWRTESPGSAVL